jgi:cyclic pyranopterin phosphate synthase
VYTCLFAGHGHPLKPLLRAGASQKAVTEHLRGIWAQRSDHYSEIRTETTAKADKVEMYHIGG